MGAMGRRSAYWIWASDNMVKGAEQPKNNL